VTDPEYTDMKKRKKIAERIEDHVPDPTPETERSR
jgi:hypothetical protein